MAERSVPAAASAPPKALVRALRRVLRPLVHLLVSQQIPYPFLANLLKAVYIEVAERDFALAGRRPTDSRISLLTGVHRKDVKRLRSELREGEAVPPVVSLGAELVARWNGRAEYLDEAHRPRPLPLQSEAPEAPSFDALVASVSKDIRPRSVLDEWLRLGVVHFDEKGRVALDAGAFVPQKGFEEKLFYFGRNLHDHIAAAAHNVMGRRPAFIDRSVYYARLAPASVEDLARIAEETGMRALQAVNRRAMELQERDEADAGAGRRINFGIYFYEEPIAEEGAEPRGAD